MPTHEEIWKDVPGYESLYKVSTHGRVYSFLRKTYLRSKGTVNFRKDSSQKVYYIGRLIMFTFVGPCHSGMYVIHEDHDRLNNRLDNLRYGTLADVIKHNESRPRNKKITDDVVSQLLAETGSHKEVAKKFGLSETTVCAIRQGRHRKYIQTPNNYVSPQTMTPEKVREIRASTELIQVLADRYGVDKSTISLIRNYKRWKEVA